MPGSRSVLHLTQWCMPCCSVPAPEEAMGIFDSFIVRMRRGTGGPGWMGTEWGGQEQHGSPRVNQVVAPIIACLERHRCTQGVIHSNAVHCRRLCAQTATLAAAAGFAPLPRVPSHRTQWDPEMHPSATTPVTALGVRSTALPPLHHRASPLPRPRPPVFSRFQRVTTRAVLSLVHF